MKNYIRWSNYTLDGNYLGLVYAANLQLPAADRDRDVFLLPMADNKGTPAPITLTRNGSAVWTFTPESEGGDEGYYGLSYTLSEVGNGGVAPGGM